ncbi:sodium/calcium exchanger NCL1-like [Phragmites australis]|uniref:sodium/calcium exchanger NCL1-like n=1 Tax=Phragmites australis TaxID=29695 RepID=UPI002D766171|nr:sodium/calcium exchanger NCL1-like [Phragmites australis]
MATRRQHRRAFPLVPLLLFLLSAAAYGRLISDGTPSPPLVSVIRLSSAADKCEQSYGFLPCTTTVLGNLFLVLTYGFLMYKAATYLSAGSELLLEIMGPGLVGGLLLPILGALPDALLVLVSGLSGSRETAQSQVLIGMGLLAGSTVFLLTLLWGSCVIVGKCDLGPNSVAVDSQDTKGFSLTGTGISTDVQTSYAARIMGLSVIPFIVAQFPKMLKTHHGQRLAILLALILSFLFVLSYCLYQVFQPWIQRRKLAYAKHKHVISGILRHAQMQSLGRLLNEDGTPNESVIRKLFHKIDMDRSHSLSRAELHALIIGINFEEIDFDKEDAVNKIMDDFDTSGNNTVEEEEFVQGMKKWLNEAKRSIPAGGAFSHKFINDYHARTREEHDQLIDRSDEAVESVENPGWCIANAVGLLLLGTAIAAAFADPLVDAVHNFSNATHIPSFFISFIALPLATNSSEAVSAIIFASRKKQRTSSLTFSEVYGGVTMNNTLCLGVFLALIYIRNLTWDFSSEVLIILLVCVIMALFTSFRTTFPLWTCFVAYSLYPLSLVVVYILDYVFGWS